VRLRRPKRIISTSTKEGQPVGPPARRRNV